MGRPKKIKPINPEVGTADETREVRVLEEIHPQEFDIAEELEGNEAFWQYHQIQRETEI